MIGQASHWYQLVHKHYPGGWGNQQNLSVQCLYCADIAYISGLHSAHCTVTGQSKLLEGTSIGQEMKLENLYLYTHFQYLNNISNTIIHLGEVLQEPHQF